MFFLNFLCKIIYNQRVTGENIPLLPFQLHKEGEKSWINRGNWFDKITAKSLSINNFLTVSSINWLERRWPSFKVIFYNNNDKILCGKISCSHNGLVGVIFLNYNTWECESVININITFFLKFKLLKVMLNCPFLSQCDFSYFSKHYWKKKKRYNQDTPISFTDITVCHDPMT